MGAEVFVVIDAEATDQKEALVQQAQVFLQVVSEVVAALVVGRARTAKA